MQKDSPKLAKPGAGLPLLESLLVRYYVGPFVAKKADWNESIQTFERINERIAKAVEGLTDEQLNTKVLVPRQRGLEDSSRYWSLAMTLEHLVIVGTNIRDVTISLMNGVVPDAVADIAKVKPHGVMTAKQAVEDFENFRKTTMKMIDEKGRDQNSTAAFSHPWFGPINARQWHWLVGSHSAIHYLQIKNIKKGLPNAGAPSHSS